MYNVKFSEEESSNGLYVMNLDFKINGGNENGAAPIMEDSNDIDFSLLSLENEQTRGGEEDDNVAALSCDQKTNVEDHVTRADAMTPLQDDTSPIKLMNPQNVQETKK